MRDCRPVRLAIGAALVLFCAALTAARAGSFSERRFPQAHITADQWQTFFDEVKAKPGAQDISRPERPNITAIAVPAEKTIYLFTKPGPAQVPCL
jgi:hypothetical protein